MDVDEIRRLEIMMSSIGILYISRSTPYGLHSPAFKTSIKMSENISSVVSFINIACLMFYYFNQRSLMNLNHSCNLRFTFAASDSNSVEYSI